ncbi:unnamed protein product, partial [marine sediment metagenome]
ALLVSFLLILAVILITGDPHPLIIWFEAIFLSSIATAIIVLLKKLKN